MIDQVRASYLRAHAPFFMHFLSHRPYRSAWITAPLVLILSILSGNSTVTLQVYDTCLLTSPLTVGLLLAVMLTVIGLVYWLSRSIDLVGWMTVCHLFLTVLFFIALGGAILLSGFVDLGDFRRFSQFNAVMVVTVSLAVLSQLIFVVNLSVGITRYFTDRPGS